MSSHHEVNQDGVHPSVIETSRSADPPFCTAFQAEFSRLPAHGIEEGSPQAPETFLDVLAELLDLLRLADAVDINDELLVALNLPLELLRELEISETSCLDFS